MNIHLTNTSYTGLFALLAAGVVALVAGVLYMQPVTAHAEATADCPAGGCLTAESDATRANDSTTRSNQRQSAIFDPGDCDDTDCAVTPGEAAVLDTTDCDDADACRSPGESARADGIDDDCDGVVDGDVCGDTDHLGNAPDTTNSANQDNNGEVYCWEDSCVAEPAAESLDTNICDGVTCSDGSCAATVSECTLETNVAPVNQNTTQPNQPQPAPTPVDTPNFDTDADGLTDDDVDVPLATSVCDGVTCPDGSCAPTSDACSLSESTNPRLFESISDQIDSDDDGLPDMATARASFMKIDDIKGEVTIDESTGQRRLQSVVISASDVRAWTPDDRAAFAVLREQVASNTPEATSLMVTQQLLNDERIESISVTGEQTEVRYKSTLRLFGLIPLEREVRATMAPAGEVSIDYPWYSFLASKPDTSVIKSLFDRLAQ